jgi:hypothetical protein
MVMGNERISARGIDLDAPISECKGEAKQIELGRDCQPFLNVQISSNDHLHKWGTSWSDERLSGSIASNDSARGESRGYPQPTCHRNSSGPRVY